MTAAAEIPDSDNVVRYVGQMGIRNGKVDGSQFCRRSGEDGLSVNWLECFAQLGKSEQIAAVRRVIHRQLGRNAVFAELNVGDIRQYLHDELPGVRVVQKPSPANDRFPHDDPSHSEIMGLPPADAPDRALIIGDLLAKRVKARHPAIPP